MAKLKASLTTDSTNQIRCELDRISNLERGKDKACCLPIAQAKQNHILLELNGDRLTGAPILSGEPRIELIC